MPCPFFSSFFSKKRLGETHLLVLIPATVDGQPYTLDLLARLIQNPKGGGYNTAFRWYLSEAKKNEGWRWRVSCSYWGLMTRDVVPGTRNKSFGKQMDLIVKKGGGVAGLRVGVPTVLEAATSVSMEYVRTGERLYSHTYTHCKDVEHSFMRIGDFVDGLKVRCGTAIDEANGLACFRNLKPLPLESEFSYI